MQYVKLFSEIGHDDINLAGGKGANLGELTRAGLPVPPGFVLTTAAYRAFVAADELAEQIVELARRPADAGPRGYEAAADRIRALFAAATRCRTTCRRARAAAYADAGRRRRSRCAPRPPPRTLPAPASPASRTPTSTSRGDDAVLAAVRDCWASLWTARAMAYRARQGIAPAAVSLAVVVQEMVEAEAAGVMFTANPANGRRDEIGDRRGMGPGRVGGRRLGRTPTTSSCDKATGRVMSRHDRRQGR